jgi:hypothetical protein
MNSRLFELELTLIGPDLAFAAQGVLLCNEW